MATINIANNTWQTQRQTQTINITTSSTNVKFHMGYDNTEEMCCAKACIAINADNYNTIQLQYDSVEANGVSSLHFGVFDNMVAEYRYNTQYDNGISPSSWSGVGVTEITSDSNKTITIDISNVTGTKYVGFLFYGNTYSVGNYGSVKKGVTITSLTATEAGYKLTYNANGGSGAPSSVSGVISTTISSKVPTRSGYDFLGWSKSSSATSASYVAGDSISLTSDTTLYAVWKKKTYEVTYDANGGRGAPSTQYKTHDTALTLSSTKPTKEATSAGSYMVTLNANGGTCSSESLSAARTTVYTFSKWNTSSKGTGTSYNAGASYTTNATLSLYAIYTSSTTTAAVILPTPTRDGYEFLGWATSSSASSGTTGSYTPTGDVTLCAIWKCMGNVYIYDGVGGFNPYQVFIYDDSGWNQYVPYIYTESGWELYSG